jgi:hypothetical protein
MDKFIKTCLSSVSDDNYLSQNDVSTQFIYLNNRILSDFFQNENCCSVNIRSRIRSTYNENGKLLILSKPADSNKLCQSVLIELLLGFE